MSVNFSDPSTNNPSLPDIGTEQKTAQVFHAIASDRGMAIAGTFNGNWEWISGVGMTAVRPNSTYHITVSVYAVATGDPNGKGIPYIRVQRGNTNTYVSSNSNGLRGRTSVNTAYTSLNKDTADGSLFCFTVKDQPGLRTGDTVTYSLQGKCNRSLIGSQNANHNAEFGRAGEGVGYDGGIIVVKEIGPEAGSTDANAIGR